MSRSCSNKAVIPFNFFGEGGVVETGVGVEDVYGDGAGGSVPVADDFAVLEKDRPEYATVVVGMMAVGRVEGDVAALVTYEILVVGR